MVEHRVQRRVFIIRRCTRYGLMNVNRIMPMLIPATTTETGDDYSHLDEIYGRLIEPSGNGDCIWMTCKRLSNNC
jgi:hypothetical protein